MRKSKKAISLVLLLFSFTLIFADYSTYFFSDSDTIQSYSTYPDISDHFEHSHSHGTEDNEIITDAKFKATHNLLPVDYICVIDINFKNNFISNIWQPPKHS